MFTPQQLDEVSFDTAVFNGYDKEAVDEFLEPLIEDYVTLYKDNALQDAGSGGKAGGIPPQRGQHP